MTAIPIAVAFVAACLFAVARPLFRFRFAISAGAIRGPAVDDRWSIAATPLRALLGTVRLKARSCHDIDRNMQTMGTNLSIQDPLLFRPDVFLSPSPVLALSVPPRHLCVELSDAFVAERSVTAMNLRWQSPIVTRTIIERSSRNYMEGRALSRKRKMAV